LIISDSNWLYPLAQLSVMQSIIGPPWFDPQTVNATDLAAMTQAFDFYKTIAAYPDSTLTMEYVNVLQQAQSNGSTQSDIENAVDAFFKGTSSYKDVTLADIMAIEHYYDNFPCVWTQYQDSITYYLYGRQGTTINFVGTLSMNKAGAVDVTRPNSGVHLFFCTGG
jgi:hypothetical protein